MRAAIAGLCLLEDGPPIGAFEIAAVAGAARLPGRPPPAIVWTDGASGLASRPICGSRRAASPVRHDGELHVALDGSLDNREELRRALGSEAGADDLDLVAEAYRRWGTTCAAHLVGEFAFVLWDARRRCLVAARDPFGCRELFHTRRGSRLLVASQLWQTVSGRDLGPGDVDEHYFADFLAKQECTNQHTPIRDVARIEAGNVLVVVDGNVRCERYWQLADAREPWPGDADDTAAAFRSLLSEAVERSLGSGDRVWAELSGGLDSSSIVCLAQELIRQRPELDRGLAAVSLVWDESPRCDERRWSRPVVDKYGLTCHWLVSDDLFFDRAAEGAFYRNEPHFGLFCFPMLRQEVDCLRRHEVDVLLSGARAESVVLDQLEAPVYLADLLRRLRLGELRRELSAWQHDLQMPLLNLFLENCLRPLLVPGSVRNSAEDRGQLDPWIDRRFARRLALAERRRRGRLPRRFRSAADQHQAERLARSEQRVNRGYIEWSCELRHPFLYRPLVELSFAIPWRHKAQPGTHKLLLREAMRGILPEEVRTRKGKRGPGESAYKAFARRWADLEPLFEAPLIAELGMVDRDRFRQEARLVRNGAATSFGSFTTSMAAEIWLRSALQPPAVSALAS